MNVLSPPPLNNPVVERQALMMTMLWHRWVVNLQDNLTSLEAALAAVAPVEGPWTPTLVGSTGGSAHIYAVQWGQSVRSGRHITIAATVELSAKDATMGGTVTLAGLPAPMVGAGSPAVVPLTVAFGQVNLTGAYTGVAAALCGGEQVLRVYQLGKGLGWDPLPASTITATTQLAVSGSYWSQEA